MRIMNKLLLCLIVLLTLSYVSFGQADQKIVGLLNREDYLELKRIYPNVKDSVSYPMLGKLSEASISLAFPENPSKRIEIIAELINGYGAELGFENVAGFVQLLSLELAKSGNGHEALSVLEQLMNVTSDTLVLSGLNNTYNIVSGLNKIPRSKVIRIPGKSAEIEFSSEVTGADDLWYFPVEVNGCIEPFIFDTGASESFVSESFARKHDVRIVADSILMDGVGGKEYVSMGVIDTLKIADIIYTDMPVYIGKTDYPEDSITVEAVLGVPFMKNVGAIRILPKMKEAEFLGTCNEVCSPNLSLYSNRMLMELYCADVRLLMFCDTGAAIEGWINTNVYENNPMLLENVGQPYLKKSRGFAGSVQVQMRNIPEIKLKTEGICKTFSDFRLVGHCSNDGELGIGFFKRFDEIIIDLDRQYISVK